MLRLHMEILRFVGVLGNWGFEQHWATWPHSPDASRISYSSVVQPRPCHFRDHFSQEGHLLGPLGIYLS